MGSTLPPSVSLTDPTGSTIYPIVCGTKGTVIDGAEVISALKTGTAFVDESIPSLSIDSKPWQRYKAALDPLFRTDKLSIESKDNEKWLGSTRKAVSDCSTWLNGSLLGLTVNASDNNFTKFKKGTEIFDDIDDVLSHGASSAYVKTLDKN